MIAASLAGIAVVLALGTWAGICLSEGATRKDADLAALVLADDFLNQLEVEADRWRWGR